MAEARLTAYLGALAAWSDRFNLTGAKTAEERVRILVRPVLSVARHLESGLLLDVGSGNGSPGLVLALLRPDLPVTLLEPRKKRWAFLREAARAAGRPDVTVLRDRHDGYRGEPGRTVTLRALGLPPDDLAHLVAPGGTLLVFGPRPAASRLFSQGEELGPAWALRHVPRETSR